MARKHRTRPSVKSGGWLVRERSSRSSNGPSSTRLRKYLTLGRMEIVEISCASDAQPSFRGRAEVQQQAKSLELRAVTSLSRLLQKQGKKDEASRMLAEIYGWFTEGLDTADLKDAKAMLGGTSELRSEVARLSGDVRTVLVFGHNPGWEEAVTELSGREMRITTANVVLLEGEGATWREALHGPWSVAGVVRPKQL
jgi:phosphohistidine phosphatase SixA